MNELDKVWLACAIDGEGSLGWHSHRYPHIKIANTDRGFADKAHRIIRQEVGVGSIHREIRYRSGKRVKDVFTVDLSSGKVCAILKQCLPYLIVKRQRALELLKYSPMSPREAQRLVKHHRNGYSPGAKWNMEAGT